MEPIFLVAGGPGVGKSTTARALAATFERSVHIDVDEFRHMVRQGLALPGIGDWPDEVARQVRLARETAVEMAERYAAAGFTVVLDDFWDPLDLAEYRDLIQKRETHRFLLYPSQDEARRRNRGRSPGADGDLIDQALPWIYGIYAPRVDAMREAGWQVLETTGLEVERVVEEIRRRTAPRGSGA